MLKKNLLLSLIFSLGLGLVTASHAGSEGGGADGGGSGDSSSGSEGGDNNDVKRGSSISPQNSRQGQIREGDPPANHPAVRAEKFMGDKD